VPALFSIVSGTTAVLLVIVLGAFLVYEPETYRRLPRESQYGPRSLYFGPRHYCRIGPCVCRASLLPKLLARRRLGQSKRDRGIMRSILLQKGRHDRATAIWALALQESGRAQDLRPRAGNYLAEAGSRHVAPPVQIIGAVGPVARPSRESRPDQHGAQVALERCAAFWDGLTGAWCHSPEMTVRAAGPVCRRRKI
jgi:hypothetical protein